jgi:hypothetical protein
MTKHKGKQRKRKRKRNLGAELLEAVRDIKAGRWARKTEFIPRKDGTFLRRITLRDGTVAKEDVVRIDGPAAARIRSTC